MKLFRREVSATGRFYGLAVFCLLVSLISTASVVAPAGQRAYDFYAHGPYRSGVPRPSAILGFEVGETHSTFRDQERVFLAIAAAAKDRVRLVEYGRSVEGRPLRLAIVSSPENLARLETIRAEIGKLADPRTLASAVEADRIVQSTPSITWINHCIHGSETASFESAMWLLYTLAASQASDIQEALHKSVIILNPVFNPDGHERFVVYYNSVAVGSPEGFAFEKDSPWGIVGRFNHYRFDMNRDKLAQSQLEVRQETVALLHWHPQVYVDQHGEPEIYFFPPNSQSINRQAGRERLEKWTTIFGKANAATFDHYGWQYVNRDTFDFFYPGYLDAFSTLVGAIGMTYETDGGGNLARRREDDTISTLRDAAAHHFEAALTTILTAARNREILLRDYLAYRQDGIAAGKTEKMRRIVLLPGSDPGRAAELATLLRRVGIEISETRAPFSSEKAHAYLGKPGESTDVRNPGPAARHDFPAGALIVDLAQPQGRLARAFLEPDADFEPEFVKEQLSRRERNEKKNDNENKEGYDFYDITAWALPYTYGLETYWTEDATPVDARQVTENARGEVTLATSSGGVRGGRTAVVYLFRYDRDAAAVMALRLLQEGYRLATATKPMHAGGKEWPRGTLIVRVSRNPETVHARLAQLAQEMGVEVTALQSAYGDESPIDLGSGYVVSLKRPRIAVVEDDMVSHTGFGEVWYLLEKQAGLAFTPVRIGSLSDETLERVNVLIVPPGFGYTGALGKGGMDRLKAWIGRGNVLVGMNGAWFTQGDTGLSTASVVGSDAKPDEPPAAPKPGEKPKPKKPLGLPGGIFRAHIDTTHFLGYGYTQDEIPVPLGGATFLKPSKKGANVVTFGKGPNRLAGFIWPDNTEELLANTAYVIDEPIGGGHAILYLEDPTFRALWVGLRRLFLNSILFGPTHSAAPDPLR